VKLKQKDVDYQHQRRDALGANESVKRLTEQIKDHVHRQNLYSIESEQLIKQIDMADAKTREKEDELLLARADYDRKLKLMEERILYKREVDADRKLVDLKHEH
jgi:multidrug resistance efflux pump